MGLLKDYDCTFLYRLEKANVVVDALGHKFMGNLAYINEVKRPLIGEIHILEANEMKFEIKELETL